MSNLSEIREEQLEELNEILAKCYDAEKGYKEAAEEVDNAELAQVFREYAQQRYEFGHAIKSEIRSLGGEPETGDTIAAKLHRAWMDLRSTFASNDETAILKEAIRGETNAIEEYEDAMEELPVSSPIYGVLSRQLSQVRQAKAHLERLVPVYES